MSSDMDRYLATITGVDTEVRVTRSKAFETAVINASYITSKRHRSKAERRELAMEKIAEFFEPVHAAVQAAWESRR